MGGWRHETGADTYSPQTGQDVQQNTQESIDQKEYRLGGRQQSLERDLRDSVEKSIYCAFSVSEDVAEYLSGRCHYSYRWIRSFAPVTVLTLIEPPGFDCWRYSARGRNIGFGSRFNEQDTATALLLDSVTSDCVACDIFRRGILLGERSRWSEYVRYSDSHGERAVKFADTVVSACWNWEKRYTTAPSHSHCELFVPTLHRAFRFQTCRSWDTRTSVSP